MAKYKVELNSSENLKNLLQETYELADAQLIQAQNEINKLSNSTNLQDEIMDAKQKYSKAINDYLSIKDKAISKKLDIAKMLSEIIKYNGNVENALSDSQAQKNTSFNFDKIRELINGSSDDNNKTETIKLNRPKS
jgi:hypothetical protein